MKSVAIHAALFLSVVASIWMTIDKSQGGDKKDEKIIIGDNITVMVIEIRGDKVRLGIEAPKEVTVHRQEVYDAIKREQDEKRDSPIDAPK